MPRVPNDIRIDRRLVEVAIMAIMSLALLACLAIMALSWFATGKGLPWAEKLAKIGGPEGQVQIEIEQEIRRSLAMGAAPVILEVESDVGAIKIAGTDDDQVVIQATKNTWGATKELAEEAAGEVIIETEEKALGHISVIGRIKRRIEGSRTPKVTFTIHVPRECELRVSVDVGDIEIEDIEGRMHIEVGVGDIDVQNRGVPADSLLTTGMGRIQVSLPKKSAFHLSAWTATGQIDSDFDVQGADIKREGSGARLVGPVGENPKATLTIRAKTGTITLRKRR